MQIISGMLAVLTEAELQYTKLLQINHLFSVMELGDNTPISQQFRQLEATVLQMHSSCLANVAEEESKQQQSPSSKKSGRQWRQESDQHHKPL